MFFYDLFLLLIFTKLFKRNESLYKNAVIIKTFNYLKKLINV